MLFHVEAIRNQPFKPDGCIDAAQLCWVFSQVPSASQFAYCPPTCW